MADSQRKSYNLAHDILIKKNDTSQYWNVLYFDADLEPNTTYTLSIDFTSTGYRFYTNGSLFTGEVYFDSINGRESITVTTKSTISKSTASQAADGRWIILKNAQNQPSTVQMSNVMINSGSTAKPYEPYGWVHSLRKLTTATEAIENPLYSDGTAITSYTIKGNTEQNGTPTPSSPVEVNGVGERTENLCDYATFADNYYLDMTTGLPKEYTSTPSRIATLTPCDVANTNTVTLSYTSSLSGYTKFIYSLFNGNTLVRRVAENDVGAVIDVSDGDKLYLCLYNISNTVTTNTISSLMLNSGSTAKTYEPYGYKIPILTNQTTTNIYLGSVQSTRQIQKLVFDGTETSWKAGGGFFYNDSITPDYLRTADRIIYCTHYQGINSVVGGGSVGNGECSFYSAAGVQRLYIHDDNYSSLDTFKAYLAQQYANGTPVTVWYVLATATTAAVNEPLMKIGDYADTLSNATSIPTTEGANSITVDTTVQPSEFTATWTGWHNASVQEYTGGVGNNKFDEQYPDISDTIIYKPIYVGDGNFTLSTTAPQTSDPAALLFLLSGNVSSGASSSGNGVWSGQNRTKAAVDGYVTIAYRAIRDYTPVGSQTMLNAGTTAMTYEPYEYGWV